MTTVKQNANFIARILPTTLLELAIDWIVDNMEPEDVFDTARLSEWAEGSGYVKEES